jgi:hypothetical protein
MQPRKLKKKLGCETDQGNLKWIIKEINSRKNVGVKERKRSKDDDAIL